MLFTRPFYFKFDAIVRRDNFASFTTCKIIGKNWLQLLLPYANEHLPNFGSRPFESNCSRAVSLQSQIWRKDQSVRVERQTILPLNPLRYLVQNRSKERKTMHCMISLRAARKGPGCIGRKCQ